MQAPPGLRQRLNFLQASLGRLRIIAGHPHGLHALIVHGPTHRHHSRSILQKNIIRGWKFNDWTQKATGASACSVAFHELLGAEELELAWVQTVFQSEAPRISKTFFWQPWQSNFRQQSANLNGSTVSPIKPGCVLDLNRWRRLVYAKLHKRASPWRLFSGLGFVKAWSVLLDRARFRSGRARALLGLNHRFGSHAWLEKKNLRKLNDNPHVTNNGRGNPCQVYWRRLGLHALSQIVHGPRLKVVTE